MKILGLMSGTSMDGLDCCLADINIDSNKILSYKIIDFKTYSYSSNVKKIIKETIFDKKYSKDYIDQFLGKIFQEYSKKFLNGRIIDLISSHGQTITHINGKKSIQVGNPKILNSFFKKPIVYNFRSTDIDKGGNGAPLVPILDWYLYKNSFYPTISINIGGISNISYINSENKKNIIGFDAGPGMCLIDQFVKKTWNLEYDKNGLLSSKGEIDNDLINHLLKNDKNIYLKPPKSLSVEYYNMKFLNKMRKEFFLLNDYSFLRTLVHYTVITIYINIREYVLKNKQNNVKIILSGGGVKNNVLFTDLKHKFSNMIVEKIDNNGINIDNKESFLMCLLGYTRYNKISSNIPSVTGAKEEVLCGEIYE